MASPLPEGVVGDAVKLTRVNNGWVIETNIEAFGEAKDYVVSDDQADPEATVAEYFSDFANAP